MLEGLTTIRNLKMNMVITLLYERYLLFMVMKLSIYLVVLMMIIKYHSPYRIQ